MTRGALVLMLDAFSVDYLSEEHLSGIHRMAASGQVATVDPMFAFRGIEATLFTGAWPDETGIWCEFVLGRKAKPRPPSRLAGAAEGALRRALPDRHNRLVHLGLGLLAGQRVVMPNLIPLPLMGRFEPTMRRGVSAPGAVEGRRTLFDEARSRGLRVVSVEPRAGGDEGAVRRFEREMARGREGGVLAHVKLNAMDHAGHRHGPHPRLFPETLRAMDAHVARVVDAFRGRHPGAPVLVFGDHGMSEVTRTVDLGPALARMPGVLGRDWLHFADSTMVRFWLFDPSLRAKVEALLGEVEGGRVLGEADRRRLRIPSDPRQGDVVFVAEEGSVIVPNFFETTSRVKGMHGYASSKARSAKASFLALDHPGTVPRELDFQGLHRVLAEAVLAS